VDIDWLTRFVTNVRSRSSVSSILSPSNAFTTRKRASCNAQRSQRLSGNFIMRTADLLPVFLCIQAFPYPIPRRKSPSMAPAASQWNMPPIGEVETTSSSADIRDKQSRHRSDVAIPRPDCQVRMPFVAGSCERGANSRMNGQACMNRSARIYLKGWFVRAITWINGIRKTTIHFHRVRIPTHFFGDELLVSRMTLLF
jgi:hypothetical protein